MISRKAIFWRRARFSGSTKIMHREAEDRADPRASPLLAEDVSGLPEAYVMLAGYDPLHDEGVRYAEKLRGAGVAVTVADYPDLVHDFIYMQAILPQAHEAVAAAAKAVAAALATK